MRERQYPSKGESAVNEMNLKYLETFIVVADVRSFTEAGQRLGLTQSAVSLQLQKLERELGARLVDRSRQPVTLTAAGEALLAEGLAVVEDVRLAREAVQRATAEVEGELLLAASTIPGEYVLPSLLVSFVEEHPKAFPKMLVTDSAGVFSLLAASRITFGFTGSKREDLGLVFEALAEDEIALVGSPDMARAATAADDLSGFPLVSREEGSGTQAVAAASLAIPAKSRLVLGSTQALLEAIRLGAGLGFVSRHAAARLLKSGEIAEVVRADLPLQRTLWVAYDPARATGALRTAFLSHLCGRGARPAK